VFAAFWNSLGLAGRVVIEGGAGFHKLQSVYAALCLLGVPVAWAKAAQLVTALGIAIALVVLWRSAAAFEIKAAGLLIGSLLATPYVMDYDLVVLGPAIAFLAAHGLRNGFAPFEILLLAALWVLPLAGRSIAAATSLALGPVVMLAAFTLVLNRAGLLRQPTAARLDPPALKTR
jgi:hypothetical protein